MQLKAKNLMVLSWKKETKQIPIKGHSKKYLNKISPKCQSHEKQGKVQE